MDNIGLLRKPITGSKYQALLKSSPNILENFTYDEFDRTMRLEHVQAKPMTSPPVRAKFRSAPKSPLFCDTLERHAFMTNVINTKPGGNRTASTYKTRYSSPSEKEASVRRSLEEISKDIKEIDDFLTATENLMREEKQQEKELQERRKYSMKCSRKFKDSPNKENKAPSASSSVSPPKSRRGSAQKIPSPPLTYKINSFKNRRASPKLLNSKLYFRNGKIGCLEAEKEISNIESTHALVKHIIKYENEKPLVSPASVRRVLNASKSPFKATTTQETTGTYAIRCPLPGEIAEDAKIANATEHLTSGFTNETKLDSPVTEETFDSCSQPIVDEDEKDVQICYKESPEVSNEEKNVRHMFDENVVCSSEMVAVNDTTPEASNNQLSSVGSLDSEGQQFLRDQVRHLVRRFTARANKMKSRLDLPPTPSSSSPSPPPTSANLSNSADIEANSLERNNPEQNPLPHRRPPPSFQISSNRGRLFEADTARSNLWNCSSLCGDNGNGERTLDPQGKIYISWLCVVSLSFLYNAWVIPLRSTFPFQTPENTNTWLICDFCADSIYLLDVVFFKHRIMYLFEGFWVKDKNLTRKNYMRKLQFKLDLLSLLPLELLYFKYGTGAVYLRFPRFLKIQSFWEVFKLLDRVISSPHFVRVAKTLTYMLYMIHLTACAYYAYSDYQGLGVNRWVFSGKGHPYVRCFAFATKTATSIGKNPKPEREGEFVFMTAAWLMGVFVFALLIGQIRDIISTATRDKNEYRQLEDETLEYMRRLNLPSEVQRRVKMWFKFTWDQQRSLDEANILDSLPINLKTDIAISVHIQTLSKVQLFADCEEALLRDLVLKLRAVTFLPGDYVCRKGEVGREMYIIKLGQVEVMGGPNSDIVLATLSEGSVFGEISLLGINGADRRTADVVSKGFSNIFVLSKSDLKEVIVYYPNAQAILKKRARCLMRKNAAREREEARARSADVVIGNPKTPESGPKLLKTVIEALPYESPAVLLITKGSKRLKKKRESLHMETIVDREVEDVNEGSVGPRDSFMLYREKRARSPDLLSSIQNELKNKHKFINLTDSEKALIVSSSSSNNSVDEANMVVKRE